jgi:hypothetical protein
MILVAKPSYLRVLWSSTKTVIDEVMTSEHAKEKLIVLVLFPVRLSLLEDMVNIGW